MTDKPRVTTKLESHVLSIGIDRPEKRNAFDLRMLAELGAAYERLADDDEARVAVLFGHGDHFSAGLDLAEVGPVVAARGPEALAGAGRFDPFGLWRPAVPKPVIMAVSGIAFTVAIELALACDIVISASDVRFRQLEIGRGIMPFGGATLRAPARLGWGNAMRFLLTGEEFGADVALRIGLAQEVVPAGQETERATQIAELIAKQAPLAVQATLENARLEMTEGTDAARGHLLDTLPKIMRSDDAREGVQSFIERRDAVFKGE